MMPSLRIPRAVLSGLAFLALIPTVPAQADEDTDRRGYLLEMKAYCSTAYTTAGRFRTDSYCVRFYRELTERGIDGEAYSFYCDLKAEELYGIYTDLMCDKAAALVEMHRMERRLALGGGETETTASN
ncbi:MAG: hypothetical protein CMN87_07345 [Stappia sp.]|uniref:hypothetical protein n=1 Tax=Stappia sp. TaxID=1870903 RepID=UPI000C659E24|nr:hypothetical protein [Stappia sp.]MAB00392.1 hypothetical protein [Stappia sp.]MBM19807.1 hypothetical protein [Stappia sp.]|tara:strand:- start:1218 stop:1601 length:384 start_codon:yes stop_codon:yes gene_type:complete